MIIDLFPPPKKLRTKLVGHKYGVSHVRFSPNGSVLASCSWDDTVGLWDVQTGMLLHYLRGHTSPVASCVFLHEGSALVSPHKSPPRTRVFPIQSIT